MAAAALVVGTSWISATPETLKLKDNWCAVYSGPNRPWMRLGKFGFTVPEGKDCIGLTVTISGAGSCQEIDPRETEVDPTQPTGEGESPPQPLGIPQTFTCGYEEVIEDVLAFYHNFTDAEVASDDFGLFIRKKSTADGPQVRIDHVDIELILVDEG